MRTKYAYLWIGWQTYAALSANGSHTIASKVKYVGFLREHKGN